MMTAYLAQKSPPLIPPLRVGVDDNIRYFLQVVGAIKGSDTCRATLGLGASVACMVAVGGLADIQNGLL